MCVCSVTQSCLTLCNPMDCSPPGSSVHEILQGRILEGIAMPSSRGSSQPRDQIHISYISCICRRIFFTTSATWEALHAHNSAQSYMDWMLGDMQTCSDVNTTAPVGTGALTNMLDGDTQGAWQRVCRNTLHCLHHSSVCLKFFKELHKVTHGIHTPLTPPPTALRDSEGAKGLPAAQNR